MNYANFTSNFKGMKMDSKQFMMPLFALAILSLINGCTKIADEEDLRGNEQRLFNLYVASRYPDAVPQADGLYFINFKAGTGISPGEDDWVLVNHVCYIIPDDYIYETYIKDVAVDQQLFDSAAMYGPYKMLNGQRNEGLTEGLGMMKEGGKATFLFTSDLGYGADGTAAIAGYKSLKYEVELLKVIKDMDAYEQSKIDAYLDTIPHYDTIQDAESGATMYYIKDRETEGDFVVDDSLITMAYKGYLTDGRVFDEKTSDDPLEFVSGEGNFISGWDLGLKKLREGESARFVIPYELAYGIAGQNVEGTALRAVPPYETLLFDVEILNVVSPSAKTDK